MNKPFPALCRDCKHSMPEPKSEWNLRCMHPKVNAKSAWALAGAKPHGTDARAEREKYWPAPCGQRGALWERDDGDLTGKVGLLAEDGWD